MASQKYLYSIKFLNSPASGRCGKKLIWDLSCMLSRLMSTGEEQCFSLELMREVSDTVHPSVPSKAFSFRDSRVGGTDDEED